MEHVCYTEHSVALHAAAGQGADACAAFQNLLSSDLLPYQPLVLEPRAPVAVPASPAVLSL